MTLMRLITIEYFNRLTALIISICPSGYLEFEGVRVVGAGDEVCVHAGAPAEGAFVGGLLVVPVLRLDALPVAGG